LGHPVPEIVFHLFSDVPEIPRLEVKTVNADTMHIRLDVSKSAAKAQNLPLLSCSVFYKQMYGSLNEILLPGNHGGEVTVTGLECGRAYQIYARCTNAIGMGSISRQMSQKTLGEKPRPPTEHDFVHPSNVSVRLDLFSWNDETCPVSYFVVEYRQRMVREKVVCRFLCRVIGFLNLSLSTHFRITAGRLSLIISS
jgi:hypothetical protein